MNFQEAIIYCAQKPEDRIVMDRDEVQCRVNSRGHVQARKTDAGSWNEYAAAFCKASEPYSPYSPGTSKPLEVTALQALEKEVEILANKFQEFRKQDVIATNNKIQVFSDTQSRLRRELASDIEKQIREITLALGGQVQVNAAFDSSIDDIEERLSRLEEQISERSGSRQKDLLLLSKRLCNVEDQIKTLEDYTGYEGIPK